jgi:hypothetical protein
MCVIIKKGLILHIFEKALNYLKNYMRYPMSERDFNLKMKRNWKVISKVTIVVIFMALTIATPFTLAKSTYETLELEKVACTRDPYENWVITITLRNPRDYCITLVKLFVNDTAAMLDYNPPTEAVATITSDLNGSGRKIQEGEEATVSIWIGAINTRVNATFSSGSIVNIKLFSDGGMDYSVLMELDIGTGFIEQSGFENISGERRSRMIVDGTLLILFIGVGFILLSRRGL